MENKATRIAVLVSGGGTNLQALIDAEKRGELGGGKLAAVISSKEGAYALERAANAGIPGYVLPRKSFADSRAMTLALVDKLHELDIRQLDRRDLRGYGDSGRRHRIQQDRGIQVHLPERRYSSVHIYRQGSWNIHISQGRDSRA